MKLSKMLGLMLIVGIPATTLSPEAPISLTDDPSACDATAGAVRNAAQREAHADFWLNVANCLNDPDCNLPDCLRQARRELQDALALAGEQYEARLDACELLGEGPYDPEIDPSKFSGTVDNTYFPLVPGRTLIYKTQTSEGLERVVVTTLSETVEINDVECRAVSDVVTLNGKLIEDTMDWYAQHTNGDAWYFGELAKNYEDGFLDNLHGSWRFGKDDAKPGIVMLSEPALQDIYRQEYLVNEAEDLAQVLSLDETVTVPYGTFDHCLKTLEWSPLEPGVFAWKFYARDVGCVLEVELDSGNRTELVDIDD